MANAGLLGSILIILVGHAITIPTALAIAEIATNLRVEGGGEYFINSRSFGVMRGKVFDKSISQTMSVSFYRIPYSGAFTLLFN